MTNYLTSNASNESLVVVNRNFDITIGKEPNLMLNIKIERDKKRDFLAYIKFSDNGKEKDISEILDDVQGSKFLTLVQQYRYEITQLYNDEKYYLQFPSITNKIQEKGIVKKISIRKGIQLLKERIKMLEDMKSINICTLKTKNEIFAITKIELDGDIMTVIPSNLDKDIIVKLLSIHNCNVNYVNKLFSFQIKSLQHNLNVLRHLIRTSSSISVGLLSYVILPSELTVIALGVGAASSLLYRYNVRLFLKSVPYMMIFFVKFKNREYL